MDTALLLCEDYQSLVDLLGWEGVCPFTVDIQATSINSSRASSFLAEEASGRRGIFPRAGWLRSMATFCDLCYLEGSLPGRFCR